MKYIKLFLSAITVIFILISSLALANDYWPVTSSSFMSTTNPVTSDYSEQSTSEFFYIEEFQDQDEVAGLEEGPSIVNMEYVEEIAQETIKDDLEINDVREEENSPESTQEFASEKADRLKGEQEGPPSWAPEHAQTHYKWSQSDQEGPPPWAAEHGVKHSEKSETGDKGPPSWVPSHARDRYNWSQSGQEGPPPWAGSED